MEKTKQHAYKKTQALISNWEYLALKHSKERKQNTNNWIIYQKDVNSKFTTWIIYSVGENIDVNSKLKFSTYQKNKHSFNMYETGIKDAASLETCNL